jgi:hypothetical protein
METPERALEEIARLILEGYTSGILDEGDDVNTRTVWELKVATFNDEE